MSRKTPANRPKRIRVLVADSHPVICEGLTSLIGSQPDMEVVSRVASGKQAVQQCLLHRPDVVLLDLRMPEMQGIETMRTILKQEPRTAIIVFTEYRGDEDIYQAMKAGAKAYLVKDCSCEEILDAIRSGHKGQTTLSALASMQLAVGVVRQRLTKREMEIMKLVANGKCNKDIGSALGLAEGTVKVHTSHIFEKLGARGRSDAIRIALERGVVHLPSS